MFSAEPVPIILDTDMGNDIDDALALAMLHALQDRGECELLGVAVSKDNPYAPAYVDLINTFYRRAHLPVGRVRDGATPEDGAFARQVVEMTSPSGHPLFRRSTDDLHAYPDAVELLRQQLADAADRSVVVVMIGFSTNMARLLDTPPDAVSPLDGRCLFEQKVRHVVMMAADFSEAVQKAPTLENREYNIHRDVPSARGFIGACPCPIVFSGLEVGSAVLYPATSIDTDYRYVKHHPVAEAYRRYKPMPYDRPTWDLTAVLYAVRPDHGYFQLSEPGVAEIDEQGIVRFSQREGGMHRYLILEASQRARVGEVQNLLASSPPASGPVPAVRRDRPAPAARVFEPLITPHGRKVGTTAAQ